MKPGELHPAEGVWKWEGADSIANWCRRNNIPMRGHCLVWHSQFADWMMYDKKGKFVKKEVFYKRLREHIHTVMNRYKDIVYCWDVVNEAIADQQRPAWRGRPAGSPYRESNLYKLCGDEFIAKAFEFAREADPKALLFYNDYNAADKGKSQRIYDMVKKMKDAGVPIDGIGMQGHYNIYGPSMDDVDAAIEKYASLVKHIHITELDIRANEEMGGQLQFSRQGVEIKPYIQTLHANQYNQLFKTLRKHKDVIDVVTFWNLSDRDSWVGTSNYPLLFDKNLKPKKAYYAVRDFNPALDNVKPIEDFKPSELNQPGQEYPMVNSQGYARFRVEARTRWHWRHSTAERQGWLLVGHHRRTYGRGIPLLSPHHRRRCGQRPWRKELLRFVPLGVWYRDSCSRQRFLCSKECASWQRAEDSFPFSKHKF